MTDQDTHKAAEAAAREWFAETRRTIEENRPHTGGSFADSALAHLDFAETKLAEIILRHLPAPVAGTPGVTNDRDWKYALSFALSDDFPDELHIKILDALEPYFKLAPVAGWQSIESAPKDGTEILVWSPIGVVHCSWLDENDCIGWKIKHGRGLLWPDAEPALWQPLPPPPGTQAGASASQPQLLGEQKEVCPHCLFDDCQCSDADVSVDMGARG